MKYPIFASFIIFCLLLMYEIKKHRNKEEKAFKEFLNEEAEANNVRRKSLDDLSYIKIPLDNLPTDTLKENETVSECLSLLHDLSTSPIVNLTGLSNTELKFKYGAPNLELLSNYDQSYTLLVTTLQRWADELFKNDCIEASRTVLEYAVSIDTDVSATYLLLAKIYQSRGEIAKIKELIPKASKINSLMSKSIVSNLEKYLPS